MKIRTVVGACLIALMMGVPAFGQDLFAGVSLNPVGTNDDAYHIDVPTDTSTAIFSQAVWGMTYDAANGRVLFTSDVAPGPSPSPSLPPVDSEDDAATEGSVGGEHLYEYLATEGVTNYLGPITDGVVNFRIDGLAMSNGTLYGSRAAANLDGIYSIDMGTLVATLELAVTDSISGIDAAEDGTIYGVNDSTGNLVEIDVAGASITNVVAYPDAGETDLDGLAVGGGKAYMIPDDNAPGLIYVYDFASGTFDTPLTAPWGAAANTFSGGAVSVFVEPPEPIVNVPTLNGIGLVLLIALLAAASIMLIRRRQTDN